MAIFLLRQLVCPCQWWVLNPEEAPLLLRCSPQVSLIYPVSVDLIKQCRGGCSAPQLLTIYAVHCKQVFLPLGPSYFKKLLAMLAPFHIQVFSVLLTFTLNKMGHPHFGKLVSGCLSAIPLVVTRDFAGSQPDTGGCKSTRHHHPRTCSLILLTLGWRLFNAFHPPTHNLGGNFSSVEPWGGSPTAQVFTSSVFNLSCKCNQAVHGWLLHPPPPPQLLTIYAVHCKQVFLPLGPSYFKKLLTMLAPFPTQVFSVLLTFTLNKMGHSLFGKLTSGCLSANELALKINWINPKMLP